MTNIYSRSCSNFASLSPNQSSGICQLSGSYSGNNCSPETREDAEPIINPSTPNRIHSLKPIVRVKSNFRTVVEQYRKEVQMRNEMLRALTAYPIRQKSEDLCGYICNNNPNIARKIMPEPTRIQDREYDPPKSPRKKRPTVRYKPKIQDNTGSTFEVITPLMSIRPPLSAIKCGHSVIKSEPACAIYNNQSNFKFTLIPLPPTATDITNVQDRAGRFSSEKVPPNTPATIGQSERPPSTIASTRTPRVISPLARVKKKARPWC